MQNDLKNLDNNELISRFKTMEKLCLDINPYEEVTIDKKKQLKELNIENIDNPFLLTNSLLSGLELLRIELNKRKLN